MTDYKRDRLSRYLAFGAIIGPLIFTFVAFSLASIRPRYSHISQLLSELGETGAPTAIVMNTFGTRAQKVRIFGGRYCHARPSSSRNHSDTD